MIQLQVNGAPRQYDGDPEMPLLWYLRDLLQLTGTKFGCGAGLCGACTVHLNGEAVLACQTSLKDASGKKIMQAAALLKAHPKPTDSQIDDEMQGNICRCGTYQRIRQAIKMAAGGKS
jgi:isoquinoline 1-oxidoreductase subunit alpha